MGESQTGFSLRAIPDQTRETGEGLRLDFGTLPPGITKSDWGPYETIEFVDEHLPEMTASFGAEEYTATEGGAAAQVSIHLNTPVEIEPAEVELLLEYGGGATAADHGSIQTVVRFPVGTQTQTITVAATDDMDDDDGESVSLRFVDDPNRRVTPFEDIPARVALEDNDGAQTVTVSFGAPTYTASEYGADATVLVQLDTAPGRQVTVPLMTTNAGGATAADHSGIPGSVTFGASQTTTTFTVTATADSDRDGGESVSIGFGTLPAGVLAGSPASTTVALADGSEQSFFVSFSTNWSHAVQVREGGVDAYLTVNLSTERGRLAKADPRRPVTVPLVVTHVGTATEADYAPIPETVTFAVGQASTPYRVRALPDDEQEPGEGLRIDFGPLPPGLTKSDWGPNETIEFVDRETDRVVVSFAAGTYTATRDNATGRGAAPGRSATQGGSDATVRVELNMAPGRRLEIPLVVTPRGTATADDYSGVPESLTFEATQTAKTFTVTAETDSTKTISIGFGSLPEGVSPGSPAAATVKLASSTEQRVTVSFGATTYTATEGGGDAAVSVELDAAFGSPVEIPLVVTPRGTATADDYSGIPESVTFEADQTAVTFTVTATPDTDAETGERLSIWFGTLPAGVFADTPASVTVELTDGTAGSGPTVTISTASNTPVAGPFTITIVFSESVTGFELDDVVVGNGVASELRGNGTTFTVTITPEASATVTVDIPAGAAQDDAGNESEAAARFSIAAELADTAAPTVTIGTAASAPVNGPFTATFTFSEEVTGFELTDLVVGNGSPSALQGDGASYTATITPAASGPVTVDVPAGAASDGAGNPSLAAQQFSIAAELTAVDDVAPTVTISTAVSAPIAGPFTITIVFSESVTGFELPDLVVGNGVASALRGNGTTFTVTITPEASGAVTVDIPAGAAQDDADNESEAAARFSIAAELADTAAPTVTIGTAASAPVNGPFTATFTFSEEVTGFELTDLVVGNGSPSALQGDGASYTATITPAASGPVTVDVPAGAASDGAGNPSLAAQQFSIAAELTAVDDVAPTVTITGPTTEPVIGPFPITVVFSEPVTGFELEDLVVGNGVASELEGNGARYTAMVIPTASGPVTVDIAAGAAEDSAGNPSTAADQFSITVELTPVPALPLAGVIALAAVLFIGVRRRRTQDQYFSTTAGR